MTSFAHCSAWWNYSDGDFSSCFEHDYLQTLIPLVACGISVLIVALQAFRKLLQQNTDTRGYTKLDNSGLNGTAVARERAGDDADDTEDDDEEEEFERNEELALQPKRSQTGLSTITVDRPSGEIAIAVVEELAVFVEIGIQVAALILNAWGKNGTIAAAANVATWGYIAVLTSMRLLLSSTSQIAFPKLWYHTAVLYGIGWICAILLFRSEIIYPRSTVSQALTSAHFGITTILFLIALMSRKGNKPVELEYEGDLEPSKEPLASLFSLATFSWIDPIVWTGYRKTTEMSDVWNLNPKDKASAILADYRQCKKTTILAFHLLKYFKRGLITQALWASISGVVTFVPTLLLKVIL
ncbi:bile acid-transporting ATPase, partial [Hortaea werneckii]